MSMYLGQCDTVRRRGPEEEANWQRMMQLAKPISVEVLLQQVDVTPILDDDETPEDFIRYSKRADPDTAAFASYWGNRRCWFLQTAGFEFIFLE
jgi:hypothetical protein